MNTNRFWNAALGLAALVGTPGVTIGAESNGKPTRHLVVVSVRQDNLLIPELGRAEAIATKLFATVGVQVKFREGAEKNAKSDGAVSLELQLHARTQPQFHPGAMAFAAPFGESGTRIHVFCDRVRNTASGATGSLLGYVLTHEIAHMLQGVLRHTDTGVMKANWEAADYRQMQMGTLRFQDGDAEFIETGLAQKAAQMSLALASRP